MTKSHHSRYPRGLTSLLLGATLTVAGGVYNAIAHLTGHVPDTLYRAPFSHGMFLTMAAFAAVTHALVLAGVLTLRRRADISRAGRGATAGLWWVVGGTGLLVICEMLTIPLVDKAENATACSIVDGLFGLATVLATAGMLTTGAAVLRTRVWMSWRGYAPLGCGILSLIAIPMEFGSATSGFAIAVYGLGYMVLGAASFKNDSEARRGQPTAQSRRKRVSTSARAADSVRRDAAETRHRNMTPVKRGARNEE
jgi:hypothetical protein